MAVVDIVDLESVPAMTTVEVSMEVFSHASIDTSTDTSSAVIADTQTAPASPTVTPAVHPLLEPNRVPDLVPSEWVTLHQSAVAKSLPVMRVPLEHQEDLGVSFGGGLQDLNVLVIGDVNILRCCRAEPLRRIAERRLTAVQKIVSDLAVEATGPRIFTAGYGNRNFEMLFASVKAADGVVLDIRMSPKSTRPEFNKERMEERFWGRYIHVPAFGNSNYRGQLGKDKGIVIADFDKGYEEFQHILKKGLSPILLCGCLKFEECHRCNVAKELNNRGHKTEELIWTA